MDKRKRMFEARKSPFNYELMDSLQGGELAYARQLDDDAEVIAWTKNHGIIIKYRNKSGAISRYIPDFLVRRKNQSKLELVEIKGGHLANDPNTDLKRRAGEDWCRQRGMVYKLIVV